MLAAFHCELGTGQTSICDMTRTRSVPVFNQAVIHSVGKKKLKFVSDTNCDTMAASLPPLLQAKPRGVDVVDASSLDLSQTVHSIQVEFSDLKQIGEGGV